MTLFFGEPVGHFLARHGLLNSPEDTLQIFLNNSRAVQGGNSNSWKICLLQIWSLFYFISYSSTAWFLKYFLKYIYYNFKLKLTAILFVWSICTLFSVVAFLVLCDALFSVFTRKLLKITRRAPASFCFTLIRLITTVKITITFFVLGYTKATTTFVSSVLARTIV